MRGSVISSLACIYLGSHENGVSKSSRAIYTWTEQVFCLSLKNKHFLSIVPTFALRLTVLRLPPGLEAVVGEGGDHVLDGVAERVAVLVVHLPGVAHEAFFFLLMDTGVKGVTLYQTSVCLNILYTLTCVCASFSHADDANMINCVFVDVHAVGLDGQRCTD